jgi:DNA-binding PadR family transcriptional regulator
MKLHHLLLGLIQIHPKVSGYQLRQIIHVSTEHFYPVHLSQIYPELKKMVDAGWVTYKVVPGDGKPASKLYSLTTKGHHELTAWLKERPELPHKNRSVEDEYILKLVLMGSMPSDSIIDYLRYGIAYYEEERRIRASERLSQERAFLSANKKAQANYLFIWEQEIDFIIQGLDARIAWLRELLDAKLAEADAD